MIPILNVVLFIAGFVILLIALKFLLKVVSITFRWLPVILLILLSFLVLVGVLVVSLTLTSLVLFGAFVIIILVSLSFVFKRNKERVIVRKYFRQHHFRRR